MKKFYEVCVIVRKSENYCAEDYKVNVEASCIKCAIDKALNIMYDTLDIYDKEILSIEANKIEYIEIEKEN